MQEDLWGEEAAFKQNTKRRISHSQVNRPALTLTSEDCIFFGHTWQVIGMQGEKRCSICQEKGYCPVCNPIASKNANPYFCTKHTPREVKVVS